MPRTPRQSRLPTRREFVMGSVAAAATAMLLAATQFDRHHLVVEEHTALLRQLPGAFHGFRIAQLSDVHFDHFMDPWFLQRVVDRVNALAPDMVAITGDFITSHGVGLAEIRREEDALMEILAQIRCPLRLCSLGNHDSIDFDGVTRALERRGFGVLMNQYTGVDLRGDRLWVGGIADALFAAPDLTRGIPRQTGGAPVLLLGHEPDIAPQVNAHGGVDLMLAGHTHGGQVRVPLLTGMVLPDLGRKYIEGPFRVGDLQLYVNRGLGMMHLPIRFRCPPEITLFTLQPEA